MEVARKYFTIWIDCAQGLGSFAGGDAMYSALSERVSMLARGKPNSHRDEAVRLFRLNKLTRVLYLCKQLEANKDYSCWQYLLDQLNGGQKTMVDWFNRLVECSHSAIHQIETYVDEILTKSGITQLVVCVDEAHIAKENGKDHWISTQASETGALPDLNGVVAQTHQRGLLGPLIEGMMATVALVSTHVIVAGNRTALTKAGDFASSHDGKPAACKIRANFKPWPSDVAEEFLDNFLTRPEGGWPTTITNASRPRWLEAFVTELYVPGHLEQRTVPVHLSLAATADYIRMFVVSRYYTPAVEEKLESHKSLVHRLAASCLLTIKGAGVPVDADGIDLLQTSLCYLASDGTNFSVVEPWVREFLLEKYGTVLEKWGLHAAVKALQEVLEKYGAKSARAAKGVAFESVVMYSLIELMRQNDFSIPKVLLLFGVPALDVPADFPEWSITSCANDSDLDVISNRKTGVFVKPPDLNRSDAIGFLTATCVTTVGVKLYSKNVSFSEVYRDNVLSTDPSRWYTNAAGAILNQASRDVVIKSLASRPLEWTLWWSVVLPGVATPTSDTNRSAQKAYGHPQSFVDHKRHVIHVFWDLNHLRLFPAPVQDLLGHFFSRK